MHIKLLIPLVVFIALIAIAHGNLFGVVGSGRTLFGRIKKIIEGGTKSRAVVVENWTGRSVRFWCASKDNRIIRDGKTYIDLKDQEALAWSFDPNVFPGFSGRTLFWCTFCYKGEKRGWNVYAQQWEKWTTNGVPADGVLRWRLIYDSVRWQYDPLKAGWDFKNWPSEGSC